MVAGAGHETGKMILEQRSGFVKSSSEKKKNSAPLNALGGGEKSLGRSWDPATPEGEKASEVTSLSPMSSFPSLSIAGGRGLGRELQLGKSSGAETGSPFTRSSGSSTDLSSSSFKSSLSGSAYGSSQDRESIGDREKGGHEKEVVVVQDVNSGIPAREKPVEVREYQKELKLPVRTVRDIMTEDPPDAPNSAEASEVQRSGTAVTAENGAEKTSRAQTGKESENGAGKESRKEENERGKQNAGIDSARESESARESGKLSMSRASVGSDSNESSCSSIGYGGSKPHKANDKR